MVRGHEDCILGIYNTWCDIIHIENKLHQHYSFAPKYLYVKTLVKVY